MKSRLVILSFAILLFSCGSAVSLTGKLIDSETKKPIVGAEVEVLNARQLLILRPIEETSGRGKVKPMILYSDSVGKFEVKLGRASLFTSKVKVRVRHTYYKTKKFKGIRFNTIELVKI